METTHTAKPTGKTQCEIILDSLRLHAGAWVSMVHLHLLSGSMAVHSRIADLRAAGHQIEQRSERKGRMVHSSYRLIETPAQLKLF